MTKLFSSDYSVLSSKAHANDKQVVYDLVALAAVFKTNINSFEESLNALIPQLESQEKQLSLAPKNSTKAASILATANIIRSEIKVLQEFIEKIKRFQHGMQTQIQEKL